MNNKGDNFTDNLDKNAQMLVKKHAMRSEGDVAKVMTGFTVNDVKALVVSGKFKSGLIFWDLALEANADGVYDRPFVLTKKMLIKIRKYFTYEVCRDAEENPETKHTTVRALLQKGEVTVSIELTT